MSNYLNDDYAQGEQHDTEEPRHYFSVLAIGLKELNSRLRRQHQHDAGEDQVSSYVDEAKPRPSHFSHCHEYALKCMGIIRLSKRPECFIRASRTATAHASISNRLTDGASVIVKLVDLASSLKDELDSSKVSEVTRTEVRVA